MSEVNKKVREEEALSTDGASSSGASTQSVTDADETFRYEIELTDQELSTAWVREHYARQGSLRF